MSFKSESEMLEKLEGQVEHLDEKVFNLTSKVELLENLLLKVSENQNIFSDILTDINYVMLKQDMDAEEIAEVPFLLVKLQKEHKFERKVPSLEEVHHELLNVLKVEEDKKSDFPIKISRQLIKAQTKTGIFPVGKEILERG